jgi:hypothetical protein
VIRGWRGRLTFCTTGEGGARMLLILPAIISSKMFVKLREGGAIAPVISTERKRKNNTTYYRAGYYGYKQPEVDHLETALSPSPVESRQDLQARETEKSPSRRRLFPPKG